MARRIRVVLGVVAVVEEEHVVERSVMARHAAEVLIVSMQRAEHEAGDVARQVRREKKRRRSRSQRRPEEHDEAGLQQHLSGESDATLVAGVMCEVAIAPERLRKSEQDAQRCSERLVREAMAEERPVDEVVRDRVRVPPDAEGDEKHQPQSLNPIKARIGR